MRNYRYFKYEEYRGKVRRLRQSKRKKEGMEQEWRKMREVAGIVSKTICTRRIK